MLTIVFTFTSALHNEAATGDGTPKNNKNEKEPTPKKKAASYLPIGTPATKSRNNRRGLGKVAAIKRYDII
jgi:hypothetical protein